MTTQLQSVTAMPQPVAVQTVQPRVFGQTVMEHQASDPLHRRKKTLYCLGVTEVVLGSLSILFAIVTVSIGGREADKHCWEEYRRYDQNSYRHTRHFNYLLGYTYASQGIWGGLFTLVSGILGIRVKNNPTRCLYIANMTMAIITANFVGVAFALSVTASLVSYFSPALTALHSVIAVVTFISSVLTIIHAAFGCCGLCCCNNSGSTQQVFYLPQQDIANAQQTQYVQGPNGQIFYIANPATAVQGTMNVTQPVMMHAPVQLYPQSASPPYSPHGQQQDMEQPPSYNQPTGQGKQA